MGLVLDGLPLSPGSSGLSVIMSRDACHDNC